ncbi:MAG: hypothetical protein R3C17_02530 [Planctomycetaceae bacterium]
MTRPHSLDIGCVGPAGPEPRDADLPSFRQNANLHYITVNDYKILDENETLTGDDVLPGLQIPIADIFGELDRQPPQADS